MTEATTDLAAVIAAHSPFAVTDPNSIYSVECGCTFGHDRADLPPMSWVQWNDHLAEALVPIVRQQRAAALCEAAACEFYGHAGPWLRARAEAERGESNG